VTLRTNDTQNIFALYYAECQYAESGTFYFYAECRYAECRYAECRYAECRGLLMLYILAGLICI